MKRIRCSNALMLAAMVLTVSTACWGQAEQTMKKKGHGGPTPGLPIEVGPDGGYLKWEQNGNTLAAGDPLQLREQLAGIVVKLQAKRSTGAPVDIVYARLQLKSDVTYQLTIRNLKGDLRVDIAKGVGDLGLVICNAGWAPSLLPCKKANGDPNGSGIPSFLVGAEVISIYVVDTANKEVENVTGIIITPQ